MQTRSPQTKYGRNPEIISALIWHEKHPKITPSNPEDYEEARNYGNIYEDASLPVTFTILAVRRISPYYDLDAWEQIGDHTDFSTQNNVQSNTGSLIDTTEASKSTAAPRWSGWVQKVPLFFSFKLNYVNYTDVGEPCTFEECTGCRAMAISHAIRNGLSLCQWHMGSSSVTSKQEAASMQMGVLIRIRIWN